MSEGASDPRSSQAKESIMEAARRLLELEGSIEAVTLTKIADETHYATSVVHYHTGGVESLRDELFQTLAVEFSFSMLLGEPDALAGQQGHKVVQAAGEWIKSNPAATRFLANRESQEIREPAISAAKAIFGIDLETDPDGLSVARYLHRSFFSPATLILDSEEGQRSIDEETIVELGLLTWRNTRAALAILADRPGGQGGLAPQTGPLPGVVSPVPFRNTGGHASSEVISACRDLYSEGGLEGLTQAAVVERLPGAEVPSDAGLKAALQRTFTEEMWATVLTGDTFDDDAAHRFVSFGSARPAHTRLIFFNGELTGVPVDRPLLEHLVPDLNATDDQLEAVAHFLSKQLGALWEILPDIVHADASIAAVFSTLEGARAVLKDAGLRR